jgi:hypothetical protein
MDNLKLIYNRFAVFFVPVAKLECSLQGGDVAREACFASLRGSLLSLWCVLAPFAFHTHVLII